MPSTCGRKGPNLKAIAGICAALLFLYACAPAAGSAPAGQLTVFAAASLAEAFEEAAGVFEAQHPGSQVVFNFAGSQQLAQQLAQGAPADLFAAADRKQMDAAIQAGRVEAGAAAAFARNELMIVFPKDNPAQIHDIQDLSRSGLRIVVADAAVPVGAYTLQFLEKAAGEAGLGESFRGGFLANVVSYEENVRSVLSKVLLGEADAGIVYATDLAGVGTGKAGYLAIPERLNVMADYYAAPVGNGRQLQLASSFVDFLRSAAGQAILARYGFLPVQ